MIPTKKADIDFTKVIELCDVYMSRIESKESASSIREADRDVFDELISAIYGEEAWEWIEDRTRQLFLR